MSIFLIHELLTETARQFPDKTALIFGTMTMSYRELDTKSSRLASFLIKRGVNRGDRVGILLNKCPEALVALFGILKSGAIYVPIDHKLPAARARYIISSCGIKHMVSSSNYIKKILLYENAAALNFDLIISTDYVSGFDSKTLSFSSFIQMEQIFQQKNEEDSEVHISDESPAYILFTSGSTGQPKGVVISHSNAMAFIDVASEYFKPSDSDIFASQAPLHFDLSVFDIYVAIKHAATIVLFPEYLSAFPIRFIEEIFSRRISVWNSASSVLALLADKGKIDRFILDAMRIVIFSGDIMPIKYLRILKKYMPRADFFNIYGQTEANSSMCYHVKEIPDDEFASIPIGQPLKNFEVFAISDDNRIITELGQEGELFIKSRTVALGYWNDPALTKERFVADPRFTQTYIKVYKTGDLVRIGKEGNYYFVGRKDLMVKSRGYRIELAEIEKALISHPSISMSVAIALPDHIIGNKIIAYIILNKGVVLSPDDIKLFCEHHLPKYMVPDIIEFREHIPMTSSGKIDRTLLYNEALSKYGK